jgi:hypothetical protein
VLRLRIAEIGGFEEKLANSEPHCVANGFDRTSRVAIDKDFPISLTNRKRRVPVIVRRAPCDPSTARVPHAFESCENQFGVHRRSSRAGIVLRSINSATASAGIRTARPQFTRGSFLRSSQARIVAGLSASISLASLIESNLLISFTSQRNNVLPASSSHSDSCGFLGENLGLLGGNLGTSGFLLWQIRHFDTQRLCQFLEGVRVWFSLAS